MRTRDFVRINNKLALVCKLMAKNKENTPKEKKELLKLAKEFRKLGEIYAKLNKRKKNGKKTNSLSKRRKRS